MTKLYLYKAVISLFIVSLIFGCSKGISDDTITSQVTNYLENEVRSGYVRNVVSFSEWFEIENISVKDKLIKDKECIAICNLSVKIKGNYPSLAGVTVGYGFIVGSGSGSAGQVRTADVKFLFEKYEKGWKIKNNVE